MSAPTEAKSESEAAEGEGGKKKLAGKTLVLFIGLPALLAVGGGAATAFMLSQPKEEHGESKAGAKKKKKGEAKDEKKSDKKGEEGADEGGSKEVEITEGEGVYFVSIPDILVNISNPDGRPAFLKLKLTIEVADEATAATIEEAMPRVLDGFNGFLREMRTDDLAGSAGSYRLRTELLRRVNIAVEPAKANAVLIEEMLIQ